MIAPFINVFDNTEPALEVWRNTVQSIPNNVLTDLNFEDGSDNTQAQVEWKLSAPSIITFREPGMYVIVLAVDFAVNVTGYRLASIFKSTLVGSTGSVSQMAVTGDDTRLRVACHALIAAGETVKAQVLQTSGAPLNVPSNFTPIGFAPCLQIARMTRRYDRNSIIGVFP